MAVNLYAPGAAFVTPFAPALNYKGSKLIVCQAVVNVLAAHADASVYRLFRVNPQWVPISIQISTTAITGGTDFDLGVYNVPRYENISAAGAVLAGGAAVDADALMDGQTMATAAVNLNGLSAVSLANRNRTLAQHAGQTTATAPEEYDLALTANTVGSADGTIVVVAMFAEF